MMGILRDKTMNEKVSIKNLQQYGRGEWSWDLLVVDWNEEKVTYHYHTNQIGEGLFLGCGHENQRTGTCQFSLMGRTKHAAYMRIKRYFESD